jgi:hypothetical protein
MGDSGAFNTISSKIAECRADVALLLSNENRVRRNMHGVTLRSGNEGKKAAGDPDLLLFTFKRAKAKCHYLRTRNPKVYVNTIPEFTQNRDPINTLGWKVVYVNSQTKGQGEKTHLNDSTERFVVVPPNGLHVFERLQLPEHYTIESVLGSLEKLFYMIENEDCCLIEREKDIQFQDPRFQMRDMLDDAKNNILFIRDPGNAEGQPKFLTCMESLKEYDKNLHDFVKLHAEYCLLLMGSDVKAFDKLQLQLIHYFPRGGIRAHIDSIQAFNETIGPIFTVNMNKGKKAFDLLPTLKRHGTRAVRLITDQGQITVMDGESRISWSHAIPYGNGGHAYTIAFKFPVQDQHKDDVTGGHNGILGIDIPQNLHTDYRVPLTTFYGLDSSPWLGE